MGVRTRDFANAGSNGINWIKKSEHNQTGNTATSFQFNTGLYEAGDGFNIYRIVGRIGGTQGTGNANLRVRWINSSGNQVTSGYYSGNYGNHLSVTFQPSSSGSRVMVGATFSLRRGGSQNNNWYARARIGGGSSLQNIKTVSTNSISYSDSNSFQLIAFDNASNTSNRTYRLQVNYTASSSSSAFVRVRNASLMVIEIKP